MRLSFGRGQKILNIGSSKDSSTPMMTLNQQYTLPGMIARSSYDNAFAPISAISDEILKRNLHLGDINDPETDVTTQYPFWNAIARPNDRMGFIQFIDLLTAGFLSQSEFSLLVWHVTGSGTVEAGKPESGFTLDNIAGFTVLSNECKTYTSQGLEEWQVDFTSIGQGQKKFHREDVLTLKYSVLPDDGVSGVSPGSASLQEAAIRDRLNQQQRALFDNGATPSLIVTIYARSHDEATTIQKAYEKNNRGAAKQGGVVYQTVIDNALLAGVGEPRIEITPVGTANNQLAIKEIIDFTQSTITSNYGVSPIIYGDATTTTFQNQELADRKFMDRVQAILVRLFSSFEYELARLCELALPLPFTFVWDNVEFDLTQEQEIKARTKTEQVRAFVGLQQAGVSPKQAQVMLELPEEWAIVEITSTTETPDLVPEAPSLNLFEERCTCEHHHNDVDDRISERQQTAQKKILDLFKQLGQNTFDGVVSNATTSEINKQIVDELTQIMQEGATQNGTALFNDVKPDADVLADFAGLSQQSLNRLEKRTARVVSNYVTFVTEKINALSDDDPAKRVFTKFYAEHGQPRAKLVAQQETKTAFQNGELDAAKNVDGWLKKNKPQSYIVKTWQTTSDAPCRFCKKMNGTQAGIQDSFVPGALIESDDVTLFLDSTYTDGTIPDAHANCQCIFKFKLVSKK